MSENNLLIELIIGVVFAAGALRVLPNRYSAFFAGYAAFAIAMIVIQFANSAGGSINAEVLVPTLSSLFGVYLISYAVSFFLFRKWWNVHEKST